MDTKLQSQIHNSIINSGLATLTGHALMSLPAEYNFSILQQLHALIKVFTVASVGRPCIIYIYLAIRLQYRVHLISQITHANWLTLTIACTGYPRTASLSHYKAPMYSLQNRKCTVYRICMPVKVYECCIVDTFNYLLLHVIT